MNVKCIKVSRQRVFFIVFFYLISSLTVYFNFYPTKSFPCVQKISHRTMFIRTDVPFWFRFWEICHRNWICCSTKTKRNSQKKRTYRVDIGHQFGFYHVALITVVSCTKKTQCWTCVCVHYEQGIKVDFAVSSLSFFCIHWY